MSRIGRSPVHFDNKVQVTLDSPHELVIKGAKQSLKISLKNEISAQVSEGKIILLRSNDQKEVRALHGMYRALVQNAVTGVGVGFSKSLELHGVGYRANVAGRKLELSLGFSHPISFDIPEGIEIKVEKQTLVIISGVSKELVGQVAAKVRDYRPPEPYLGKGVRYSGEHIRRKAGKSAGK